MTPKWTDFILSPNVPNFKTDFSKLDFLDIETYANEMGGDEGYFPIVGIVVTGHLCQLPNLRAYFRVCYLPTSSNLILYLSSQ